MKVKDFFQELYDITGMDPNEPTPSKWVDISDAEINEYISQWDYDYRDDFLEAIDWALTRIKELNK